eukprot:NODE_1174_length_1622_cov_26.230769_g1105_i0.p1 GENE.NODE_1174_length_1622_cov_26.230769_g1105_i0~~NODE_1174_length_1622_cov_26.230769_g1105_i0.p1  ORF type:complete len:483 (+),score=177.28 NODE_1174_length_1622_cov_26.230769_g1105_i0:157-1449(+)
MTAQSVDNHPRRVNLISSEQALLEQYEAQLQGLRDQMQEQEAAEEQRQGLIGKLQQEKRWIERSYDDKIRSQEKESAELQKRFANLSRFVLTSSSRTNCEGAVRGIGIDEELLRTGGTAKPAAPPPAPLQRRSSFCCLRDTASKSLFAYTAAASQVPPTPTQPREAFLEDVQQRVVKQQKAALETLRVEIEEKEVDLLGLEHLLQQCIELQLADTENQVQAWVEVADHLQLAGMTVAPLHTKLKEIMSLLRQKVEGPTAHIQLLRAAQEQLLPARREALSYQAECVEQLLQCQSALALAQHQHTTSTAHTTTLANDLASTQVALQDQAEALQRATEERQECEADLTRSVASIESLTLKLAARDSELNQQQLQLETARHEQQAFERYYRHKKAQKPFQTVRNAFCKPIPLDHKPWLRFLPPDTEDDKPPPA